jgi:hypothetical protein
MTVGGRVVRRQLSLARSATAAAEDLEAVADVTDGATRVIDEVVADRGYHSNQALVDLAALDLRRSNAPAIERFPEPLLAATARASSRTTQTAAPSKEGRCLTLDEVIRVNTPRIAATNGPACTASASGTTAIRATA